MDLRQTKFASFSGLTTNMEKKEPPVTEKLKEKWRQQVAEERLRLFTNLKFDKWGSSN